MALRSRRSARQIHHVGDRLKGVPRLAQIGHLWDLPPNDAQHRLKILQCFARYGLAATREAFGVSRRTLYRWRLALQPAGGHPAALAARSSAPHRRRQASWPPALSQELRRRRTRYPNLGKAKLPGLVRPWCAQQGVPLPSVSTISRLIARAPDQLWPGPRAGCPLCPAARPTPRRPLRQRRRVPGALPALPDNECPCGTL